MACTQIASACRPCLSLCFTRISLQKVRWSVTVDDPQTWTKVSTFSLPLTPNDSEPIMQYECHEGNYGLRNSLSAARVEERAT